jgi:DNA-binding CsgD family transcriptional regulator
VTNIQPLPDRIERFTLLSQALIANPSWDELTRLLALRIFDFWGCEEVLLYGMDARGSLALKSSYGVADTAKVSEVTLENNPELASVLSYGRTTWVVDAADGDELVPAALGAHDKGGVVIAPLNRVNIPEYVLIVTFKEPLPENPASAPFMSSIVSLLELRVAMAKSTSARKTLVDAPEGEVEFTERQQRILERIQDGKTNKSIARELGFSESTIRQETLRLYRSLGVNTREDAVIAARVKGLLDVRTTS